MRSNKLILLAGCFLLALTAGCGSSANAGNSSSIPAASEVSASSASSAPAEEADKETPLKAGTISRRPEAFQGMTDIIMFGGTEKLFTPDPYGNLDLRSAELTAVDLSGMGEQLLHASFDDCTKWAPSLPKEVSPAKLMELGKNPGLGIRSLHSQGITGKGVGIAIIDQPLLVEHQEYADRVRLYQEYNQNADAPASMHGAAVSSIALGKTTGVAPDALLYYIADQTGSGSGEDYVQDMTFYAQDIDRFIALNETLPKDEKIRIISMSIGYMPDTRGAAEMKAAVERARAAGIAVVQVSDDDPLMDFFGMGRKPYSDPDDPAGWLPGNFAEAYLYDGTYRVQESLLVPMDRRTTASLTGSSDYAYYVNGGMSWTVPYMAGLYALACQVKPEVTFEEFFQAATKTAHPLSVTHEGKELPYGRAVDPAAILETLKG